MSMQDFLFFFKAKKSIFGVMVQKTRDHPLYISFHSLFASLHCYCEMSAVT